VQDLPFDGNREQTQVSAVGTVLASAERSPLLLKYVALLAAILVVMTLGVRPLLRRLAAVARNAPAPEMKELAAARTAALNPPGAPAADLQRTRAQQILEEVSGHLKREPAQTSRLLQSWIHSD
jgi:flagellar M-ring protein FliF